MSCRLEKSVFPDFDKCTVVVLEQILLWRVWGLKKINQWFKQGRREGDTAKKHAQRIKNSRDAKIPGSNFFWQNGVLVYVFHWYLHIFSKPFVLFHLFFQWFFFYYSKKTNKYGVCGQYIRTVYKGFTYLLAVWPWAKLLALHYLSVSLCNIKMKIITPISWGCLENEINYHWKSLRWLHGPV